jgi:hypothetical protein
MANHRKRNLDQPRWREPPSGQETRLDAVLIGRREPIITPSGSALPQRDANKPMHRSTRSGLFGMVRSSAHAR